MLNLPAQESECYKTIDQAKSGHKLQNNDVNWTFMKIIHDGSITIKTLEMDKDGVVGEAESKEKTEESKRQINREIYIIIKSLFV